VRTSLAVFVLLGAGVGWGVWSQYGLQGVGLFLSTLLLLAVFPWMAGAMKSDHTARAWGYLAEAFDAVGGGAPVPEPDLWEPWLMEMAAARGQYEQEIYERAAVIAHPFREPFQRLLCGFATDRARELAHQHLQAHPGDLVAPQLAAYLIARGEAGVHGAAVAAALQACATDELFDPATSLLSRVEAGGAAAAWAAATAPHHAKLRDALDDDDVKNRWDAVLGPGVTDAER